MPVRIPRKPFDDYKWRWAEFTPSEGLNNPLRLLGVLRAMRAHEGKPKTTIDIQPDLQRIESDTNRLTGERVHLARVGERNLFRNSDRYWKAVGLMDSESRNIQLTPLGEQVADGEITQNEFAIHTIRTMTLPNRYIDSDSAEWRNAGLRIKPLELILEVLSSLNTFASEESYLTSFELRTIIIPLAGENAPVSEHVEALRLYRSGRLNIAAFPDCAPRSNDRRMVREFLLFLSYYGFCLRETGRPNDAERFFITQTAIRELGAITSLTGIRSFTDLVTAVRQSPVIAEAERRRILVETLSRPQQTRFRREILSRYNNACLLTGETTGIVLEACHLIPVKHRGTDSVSNGLCLRADLHILFDSKHLRIRPDGRVQHSEVIRNSPIYRRLPQRVRIPDFVSEEALRWRYEYY